MTLRIGWMACASAAALMFVGCGDIGSKPSTNVSTGPGIDVVNAGTGGGGGGGGFGTGFDTGLDPNRPIDDLSAAEVAQTCQSFERFLLNEIGQQELIEFTCSIEGFFGGFQAETDAQARMICEESRDSCLAQGESQLEFGCPTEDAQGCADVTVGDLEACTNAQVGLFKDNQDIFVCANASTNPEELAFLETELPECAPIENCEGTVVVGEGSTEPDPGG